MIGYGRAIAINAFSWLRSGNSEVINLVFTVSAALAEDRNFNLHQIGLTPSRLLSGILNARDGSVTEIIEYFYSRLVSDDSLLPPQSAYVPVGGAECGMNRVTHQITSFFPV